MLTIRIDCRYCGRIGTKGHWSAGVTFAAAHEHQPVTVMGEMSRADWRGMPNDYKSGGAGNRKTFHLDSDGTTILIPVYVTG